jgi:ABC-type glycerol-3-phosphate transport system permease component
MSQTATQPNVLTTPQRKVKSPGKRLREISAHALLIVTALIFLVPFVWLVLTSLKPANQVFSTPLTWWPNPIRWENYSEALTSPAFPFWRLLSNTLAYALLSTAGVVISSCLVAYPFARMQFRGRDTLFAITLATMMLPSIVTLIPTYVMFRAFGLVGTYAPLVLPLWFGSAFNIFLLRQFMMTIPMDLTDAARVDGANDLVILWRVLVPLVKPALLVVGLFQFLAAWNDFLGPLIYVTDADSFPLVVGLYAFTTRMSIQWNLLTAASMVITLPMIMLFFVMQRYFIEGVVMTGMKGT